MTAAATFARSSPPISGRSASHETFPPLVVDTHHFHVHFIITFTLASQTVCVWSRLLSFPPALMATQDVVCLIHPLQLVVQLFEHRRQHSLSQHANMEKQQQQAVNPTHRRQEQHAVVERTSEDQHQAMAGGRWHATSEQLDAATEQRQQAMRDQADAIRQYQQARDRQQQWKGWQDVMGQQQQAMNNFQQQAPIQTQMPPQVPPVVSHDGHVGAGYYSAYPWCSAKPLLHNEPLLTKLRYRPAYPPTVHYPQQMGYPTAEPPVHPQTHHYNFGGNPQAPVDGNAQAYFAHQQRQAAAQNSYHGPPGLLGPYAHHAHGYMYGSGPVPVQPSFYPGLPPVHGGPGQARGQAGYVTNGGQAFLNGNGGSGIQPPQQQLHTAQGPNMPVPAPRNPTNVTHNNPHTRRIATIGQLQQSALPSGVAIFDCGQRYHPNPARETETRPTGQPAGAHRANGNPFSAALEPRLAEAAKHPEQKHPLHAVSTDERNRRVEEWLKTR